jgi:IcmF-related N-terminal domain
MWYLLALLRKIWLKFRKFRSILLPFFKDDSGWRMKPGMRWVLHILFLGAFLGGLYCLNQIKRIQTNIDPPLTTIWLPLVGLLVYLIIWAIWWFLKLWQAEPEPSTFPEIDEAWEIAMKELAKARLQPGDLPLFLVLGRPYEAEANLFSAAVVPEAMVVKPAPSDPLAPIHVCATRDGIFVTCNGASLLGKQTANLALEGMSDQGGGAGNESAENFEDENKTIKPDAKEKEIIKKLVQTQGRQMSVLERRTFRRENLKLPFPNLLKRPGEMEDLEARLAHLGRLLVRERHPLCPINGLLILVPICASDTDQDAQQTAELCARDLTTLRRVLKLQCPLLVLCCDLEVLPGFRDFIRCVPPKDRLGRLGQRFRLAPDLPQEDLQHQVEDSIHFLCDNYMRDWVFRMFQIQRAGGADDAKTNTNLYLFLDEMRGRKRNLSRIVTQGIIREAPLPPYYAGCYLAGTGSDKDSEQAFVAGVIKRLMENQSYVSWTEAACKEDERFHDWANRGYTILSGFGIVCLALLCFLVFRVLSLK